uniref:NADH-ubiquinone oxidoreductase chain 2 n=1 Tax=Dryops ernesti TaxID=1553287 RepID=A0A343A427_9COLE|nr:NADH dehydrogenase subunit 2 [Dryops ernesti]AOY39305.1 NADH dehydrogenase subunit 2 [Dryops ernesti]
MFSSTLMMGTLIAISSYSWFGLWVGLEINLLSMIPLMSNTKNSLSSEAALKYFITQALASTFLMFAIISMMMIDNMSNNLVFNSALMMVMNSAILTKMGAAPFHFWFPEVMEGLNWMNCLVLLTWQKIAPMIILMYNVKMTYFFLSIIITSMLISGLIGMNQISLRKIMAYSSINHIAWMISSMMFIETVWLYYFIVYTIISLNMILIFMITSSFYLKQLFSSMNNNMPLKLFFIMNFLSLGGLPPFLGFMPKWLTIQTMVENSFTMLAFIMVILTLITLYFYTRISFSTILLSMNEPQWNKISSFKKWNTPNLFLLVFLSISSLVICTMLFNWL